MWGSWLGRKQEGGFPATDALLRLSKVIFGVFVMMNNFGVSLLGAADMTARPPQRLTLGIIEAVFRTRDGPKEHIGASMAAHGRGESVR